MSKITWKMIYSDFRKRFPNLKKQAMWWHPYSYATIEIYLEGGYRMLYNYDTHSGTISQREGAERDEDRFKS